ncbi:MAG: PEP-CTERM sorting domain-containing protein, partial [Crocosphaera sp.]
MNCLLRGIVTALAISSSWFAFTNKALADIKLTTGTPAKAGVIIIKITLNDGRMKTVNVTIPEGTTSTGKATLINNAFQQGLPFALPPLEQMGNMLTFPKIVDKFEKLRDTTGETTRLAAVNGQKAKKGQIDGEFIEIASVLAGV